MFCWHKGTFVYVLFDLFKFICYDIFMNNIIFVGLDYGFVKNVVEEFSTDNNMHPLDTNGLIEYSLINPQKVKDVCGVEYFEREQKKIILSMCDYENVAINLPYELILNEEYYEIFKKFPIVFIDVDKNTLNQLNLSKQDDNNLTLELLAYDELKVAIKNKASISTDSNGNVCDCVEKLNKLNIINMVWGEIWI